MFCGVRSRATSSALGSPFLRTSAALIACLVLSTVCAGMARRAEASSHREAPAITEMPKVDGTDVYLFRSYESGRDQFLTVIADYLPLQDPYGGPNYWALDPEALYEIHFDNNGDALEDITFQFRFQNMLKGIALPVGDQMVPIPLINAGPIGPAATDTANLNQLETYSVTVVRGDRRTGQSAPVTNDADGQSVFRKPVDNIGMKSIPNYAAYANDHIYSIDIPGCGTTGRMFVGQREEPFVVNLGEVFDLVNTNPVGPRDAELDDLDDKNITSLILELPISCVTGAASPIVGAWTTASLRQARVLNPSPSYDTPAVDGGAYTQVSRLGMPLVNEVVIGLPAKNQFNASEPKDDVQFLPFVTNPTLPELLEILFASAGVQAPNVFPRQDLVAVFLTGVSGLNQPPGVTAAEMLRLNTAIAPRPADQQDSLGVLAMDTAGFPNGRRPGDDVVDIALRVAMGVLLPLAQAPSGQLPLTDGALVTAAEFQSVFPYLNTPIPGSPKPGSPN